MKVIKRILIVLITFITLLTTTALVVWYNLDILATPTILSKLQKRWLPEASIEWNKLEISIANDTFYKRTLKLLVTEPTCLRWKSSELCLNQLDVLIPMTLKLPFHYNIEKFVIVSNKTTVNLDEIQSQEEIPFTFNIHNQLLTYKSTLNLILNNQPDYFNIKLENLKIHESQAIHDLNITLNPEVFNLTYKQPEMKLDFAGTWEQLNKKEASLNMKAKVEQRDVHLIFQAQLLADVKGFNQLQLSAKDKSLKNGLEYFDELKLKLNLNISEDKSLLTIRDINFKPDYGFDHLVGKSCLIEFNSNETKSTNWDCKKLHLTRFENRTLKNLKTDMKAFKEMLSNLDVSFNGYLNEKNLFSQEEEKLANINFKAVSTKSKLLTLNIDSSIDLYQSTKKLTWEINKLDTNVHIKSFAEIVKKLDGGPWAVPMPLNALDGEVKFNIENIVSTKEYTKIKAKAVLELHGEGNQRVDLVADGHYQHNLNKEIPHSLEADVILKKIIFHLPPLDPIRGIPAVTADSRVNEKPIRKQTTLDYKIKIKSEKKDSIQLYYKHFEPFLTSGFSGQFSNEFNLFNFDIQKAFDISYLRRVVKVERFNVKNNSTEKDKIYIDGRMTYQASGYLIFIDLIGNIENPNVKLSSQPDLGRDDIISLLLYKRTRSELTSSEKQNVGGADAALTDRAIGLIGIWAFASTPIESIYYNSQDRSYQAQIGLPGEVKLSLGTNWESTQFVGLKKRISSRWSVVTGYESGNEQAVGNIFLQREYTY